MNVRHLLAAAALFATALPATAQTAEQWITRARARLGTENALQGMTSVRFIGTIEENGSKPRAMDIIFQKPLQQRINLSSSELVEIVALDDYDGWQKRINPKNPTQWQLTLLDASQIKRLRAQAWDNLNFLRNIDRLRGTVKVVGEEKVDGLDCVKLVFTYYENIVLTRYFEKATARLVKTETETGVEIREEGEMFAQGVRYPRKVTNRDKGGKVVTMTFEKIVLNETYPASEFAVPALPAN